MTEKEAINHIMDILCENNTVKHSDMVVFENEKEALRMAVKLLEQEPCEDAISREVACNVLTKARMINDGRSMEEIFAEIPSVIPKEKTGHWIGFTHSAYHGVDDDKEPIWREVKVYHCSKCNRRTVIKENYCPNCGLRMVENE